MRAALATLDAIKSQQLDHRAIMLGERLRCKLNELVPKYEMLKEIRGIGLMNGVVFQPPKALKLRVCSSRSAWRPRPCSARWW